MIRNQPQSMSRTLIGSCADIPRQLPLCRITKWFDQQEDRPGSMDSIPYRQLEYSQCISSCSPKPGSIFRMSSSARLAHGRFHSVSLIRGARSLPRLTCLGMLYYTSLTSTYAISYVASSSLGGSDYRRNQMSSPFVLAGSGPRLGGCSHLEHELQHD